MANLHEFMCLLLGMFCLMFMYLWRPGEFMLHVLFPRQTYARANRIDQSASRPVSCSEAGLQPRAFPFYNRYLVYVRQAEKELFRGPSGL